MRPRSVHQPPTKTDRPRGVRGFRPVGLLLERAMRQGSPLRRAWIPFALKETLAMSTSWTVDDARQLYAVPYWSDGYVDIDAQGGIVLRPRGANGPSLTLPQIVDQAKAQGLRLPLLVRFPDILADRLQREQGAFA